jgi:hypothetical protein
MVCGRRFGKSVFQINRAIEQSLNYTGEFDALMPPVVLVGMPTLKKARQIFFKPIARLLSGHPLVESIDRTNSVIRFKGKRPEIVFAGLRSEESEKVRGFRIYSAIVDEAQDVPKSAITEVILPAMGDTAGSMLSMTGTPKGKQGTLYDFAQMGGINGWEFFHFKTIDNLARPELVEEVRKAKDMVDARIFRQEYEASFEDFPGKIYTAFNRSIIASPPTEFNAIFLGVDWGDRNPALTVIGFDYHRKYWLLDQWTNTTELPIVTDDIHKAILQLCGKWTIRRTFCDPSRPGAIEELRRLGHRENIDGLKRAIRGVNKISMGLTVINNLFHQKRLLFSNALPEDVLVEFESYRHATNQDGVVLDEVEDGQSDHRPDSLRYVLATLEAKHDLTIKGLPDD